MHTFATDEEAVSLSNAAPAFLLGAVYTKDVSKGMQMARNLRGSICMVNGQAFGLDTGPSHPHPAVSFWGQAGFGSDCSRVALATFFTGLRAVGVNGPMPGAVPCRRAESTHETRGGKAGGEGGRGGGLGTARRTWVWAAAFGVVGLAFTKVMTRR